MKTLIRLLLWVFTVCPKLSVRHLAIKTVLSCFLFYILTEFPRIETDIPCGYGFSAPLSLKCLYDLDEYHYIKGCRSLAHLQDCGKFLTVCILGICNFAYFFFFLFFFLFFSFFFFFFSFFCQLIIIGYFFFIKFKIIFHEYNQSTWQAVCILVRPDILSGLIWVRLYVKVISGRQC